MDTLSVVNLGGMSAVPTGVIGFSVVVGCVSTDVGTGLLFLSINRENERWETRLWDLLDSSLPHPLLVSSSFG